MDTVSGRQIKIVQPSVDDVDIRDIAHHLAMMVRFNGAIEFFYSVGEHSLNVCYLIYHLLHENVRDHDGTRKLLEGRMPVLYELEEPPDVNRRLFWGAILRALFHDGSEAYLGDCIRPLKQVLPAYKHIERQHMSAIHAHLGFREHEDWLWADRLVDVADLTVFRIEEQVLRNRESAERYPGLQFCYREDWTKTRDRFLWLTDQILPHFRAAA
jgi:hypothetical protein